MLQLATATPITFIITTDAARARAFYTGTLDLPFGRQDDFAVVYDLGGALLRVVEIKGHTASAHSVLGWKVSDIAATVSNLAAKGVSCTIYEGFGQDAQGIWTSPDGTARVAWFNDPDGNVLSLTQS